MSEASEQVPGYTAESYFELAERGLLEADDRVELLEGVIVAAPPQAPLHASVIMCVDEALRAAIGRRAAVRIQLPLLAGPRSVPEPDLAVVPGTAVDYRDQHPSGALLVVEVAEGSLPQDRLTKSRIYAQAGVVEYWIVNLRDRRVEIYLRPDVDHRVYAETRFVELGDTIEPAAFPGAKIAVANLFPGY